MKKTYISYNSKDGIPLTEWMRIQTLMKLNDRFRATHLADEMQVTSAQMSRFLNGKSINQEFINKWFNYFM